MSNATLAQRITAALDAPGVHPGDERWFAGFDNFFAALKDGADLSTAVNTALDSVGCSDLNARKRAFNAFDGRKVVGAKASPSAPRDSFSERHGDSIDKAKASVKKLFGKRNG